MIASSTPLAIRMKCDRAWETTRPKAAKTAKRSRFGRRPEGHGEGDRPEELEEVGGKDLEPEPGGLGPELRRRVDARAELILERPVDLLDRAHLARCQVMSARPSVAQSLSSRRRSASPPSPCRRAFLGRG